MNCKKKKNALQYQKLRINKKKLNMDKLHFLPNNILTRFFKELTKYKNDYISIVFKLYIYIYINYIIHHNIYLLNISIHIYA